ncbi:hypothetical protein [Lewinella sp. IMCC34191]|uniref:hypothetical protein n=1 Tax=Lewinella sp. IMCC34191 TaxID=2259172 RepID=UPI00130031CA|nr:hypothetical protein [Lewinella sp. IMCC34191]
MITSYAFHRVRIPRSLMVTSCLILLVLGGTGIYIQEVRKTQFWWWYGIAPSFLSAVGFPFAFTLLKLLPGGKRKQRVILLSVSILVWHALYEGVLWLEGRPYDWWDNAAAVAGSLIGAFLLELVYYRVLPITDKQVISGE